MNFLHITPNIVYFLYSNEMLNFNLLAIAGHGVWGYGNVAIFGPQIPNHCINRHDILEVNSMRIKSASFPKKLLHI